jgi:hypothetical protein
MHVLQQISTAIKFHIFGAGIEAIMGGKSESAQETNDRGLRV